MVAHVVGGGRCAGAVVVHAEPHAVRLKPLRLQLALQEDCQAQLRLLALQPPMKQVTNVTTVAVKFRIEKSHPFRIGL